MLSGSAPEGYLLGERTQMALGSGSHFTEDCTSSSPLKPPLSPVLTFDPVADINEH